MLRGGLARGIGSVLQIVDGDLGPPTMCHDLRYVLVTVSPRPLASEFCAQDIGIGGAAAPISEKPGMKTRRLPNPQMRPY
jgi:hypothetical protein